MAACLSGWRCAGIASKALALIKFLISTCFASFIFCFSSGSRDLSLTSIALLRSCGQKWPKVSTQLFPTPFGFRHAYSYLYRSRFLCPKWLCIFVLKTLRHCLPWTLFFIHHSSTHSPPGARCCPRRGRTFWKCFLSPNTFEGSHGFFIYPSFILHVIGYFISHIIILSNPYICHPLNVRKSKADGGDWPTPPGILLWLMPSATVLGRP